MMESTSRLTLNLQYPNIAQVAYAMQGDRLSRAVVADLIDGSTPWAPPAGAYGLITASKPDGTFAVYDTLEDGSPAIVIDGSTVTLYLAEQVLADAGAVKMSVAFFTSAGARLTTFRWTEVVAPEAVLDRVVSENYISVFTATMDQIADDIDEAQTILDAIKAAYGAPLTANTAAAMIDTNRVYVYTGTTTGTLTNGHWYYWDGTAWADGGVYNSTAFETDTTLTIAGAAADAKATGDAIGDIKNALKYSTGNEAIAIAVKDKYLKIINNVIDVNNPQTSSSGYGYAIVPCAEGDVFIVSGVSANIEPMAWAFTDSSYAILTKAAQNVTITDAMVVAPANSSYLVIHDKSPYRLSYKGVALQATVYHLNRQLNDTTDFVLTGNLLPTYLFSQNSASSGMSGTLNLDNGTVTVGATSTKQFLCRNTAEIAPNILIVGRRYRMSFDATVNTTSGSPCVLMAVRGAAGNIDAIVASCGPGLGGTSGSFSAEFTATEYMRYFSLFVSYDTSANGSQITYSNIKIQEIEYSANDKKARTVIKGLPRYTKMFPTKRGYYSSSLTHVDNEEWECLEVNLDNFDLTGDLLLTHGRNFGFYSSLNIPTIAFVDESNNILYSILGNANMKTRPLSIGVPNGAKRMYINFFFEEAGPYCSISNYLKPISEVVKLSASNSSVAAKQASDFVCEGQNDEALIKTIINTATVNNTGLVLELARGTYYIDSFPIDADENADDDKVAISIPQSIRNFSLIGEDVANPTSRTDIVVSDSCYEALDNNTQYTLLRGEYVSNALNSTLHCQIKNICFRMPWNQKRVRFLDMKYCNTVWMEKVFCRAYRSGYDGHTVNLTHPPAVAVDGCVGIRGTYGSNNGVVNNYISVLSTGFHDGFEFAGEHLIGINLATIFCVYGYTFGNYAWKNGSNHPMTFINCCDERNVNLPLFVSNGEYGNADHTGRQAITFIDFNIERIANYTPGGVLGDYAVETYPNAFKGSINYTIQKEYGGEGNSVDVPFWKYGSGNGMKSRNDAQLLACDTATRLTYAPNYLQRIFDTTLGKEVICIDPENGTWVDASGNSV